MFQSVLFDLIWFSVKMFLFYLEIFHRYWCYKIHTSCDHKDQPNFRWFMSTPLLRKENVICNFFTKICVSKLVIFIWNLSDKQEENVWRKNKVSIRSSEKNIATFLTHKVIIWLLNLLKMYLKYQNYAKLILWVLNQTIQNFFMNFFELGRGLLRVPHNAS